MSAEPTVRQAFAPSPCGGVVADVAGAAVLARASGALWIEAERLLVAADLHLEKGSAYAARGQLLPPYDTGETLARLTAEALRLRPRAIVLLGDTFHDDGGESRLAADDARALRSLAAACELIWIVGNHDTEGPRALPGVVLASLGVCGLALVHEPAPGPTPGEVAGHLHPCARIKGRTGSVRRRCFVTDGERLVMPAFGAYAGGLNVRDAAFRGLFTRPPFAIALGQSRAHAVAWPRLGGD